MEDLLLSRVEKSFLASFVLFMIIGSLGVVLSTTFLDVYDMTGASISLDFYFFLSSSKSSYSVNRVACGRTASDANIDSCELGMGS